MNQNSKREADQSTTRISKQVFLNMFSNSVYDRQDGLLDHRLQKYANRIGIGYISTDKISELMKMYNATKSQ